MLLFWSYLAGLLTLINPCVLPLLPIIIASAFQRTRLGPLALAFGLVVSFTVVGLLVTAFGHLIGLDEERLNQIAASLMIVFGLVLLLPKVGGVITRVVTPVATSANVQVDRLEGTGLAGQAMIGVLLGAVWSPCIGPTLGGAIGLAASGENLGQAAITMLFFGLGVATMLLALAYGSREVLASRQARLLRWMPWAKPVMGVVLLLVGVVLLFRLNHYVEGWLLDIMPIWLQDLSVRF
ncbi:MAG: cytochrome c biogenesis CcdA family protein [Gammaproteobacteria bacterium]|nr:cytochrome c biogenesis CcdA family protein [Gammaproteobacteria bacterium]